MYGYVSAGRYEVSDFESYDATTDTWTLKKDVNKSSAVGTARPGMMKLKDLDNSGDANGEKDKRSLAMPICIQVDSTSMPAYMVSTWQPTLHGAMVTTSITLIRSKQLLLPSTYTET